MDEAENRTCHLCDVTVEDDVSVVEHMVTEHSNGTTAETPGSGRKPEV